MPGIYGKQIADIADQMGRRSAAIGQQRVQMAQQQYAIRKQQAQTAYRNEMDRMLFDEDMDASTKRQKAHEIGERYKMSLSDASPYQQSQLYPRTSSTNPRPVLFTDGKTQIWVNEGDQIPQGYSKAYAPRSSKEKGGSSPLSPSSVAYTADGLRRNGVPEEQVQAFINRNIPDLAESKEEVRIAAAKSKLGAEQKNAADTAWKNTLTHLEDISAGKATPEAMLKAKQRFIVEMAKHKISNVAAAKDFDDRWSKEWDKRHWWRDDVVPNPMSAETAGVTEQPAEAGLPINSVIDEPKSEQDFMTKVANLKATDMKAARTYYDKWVKKWQ